MKTIYKCLLWGMICCGLFSCNDDFLEQSRQDAVGTATFWNTAENVEKNLAACYSVNVWAKWEAIRLYVPDFLRADDCMPKHFVGWYGRSGNFTNNSSYEGSCENTIWTHYYKGIFYCNQVITYTPNAPEANIPQGQKDSLIAEARFLRGYYHFELYKHFKNIVYMDVLPEGLDELYPNQATQEEVLVKLVADFEFAIEHLPQSWPSTEKGRATKGAAWGYLGKTYLWFEEYAKAADAFAEVDDLGYKLLTATMWGRQFYGSLENSTESIFEIQFRQKDIADNKYGMLQFVFTPYHWGEFVVSDTLFNAFCSELTTESTPKPDPRLMQSIAWHDTINVWWKTDSVKGTIVREGNDSAIIMAKDIPYYRSTFEEYGKFWGQRAGVDFYKSNWIAHRWVKKYCEMGSDFMGDEMTGINFIRMRYADVLLMHAEALNEDGRTAEAVVPLNIVRKRARMRQYTGVESQEEIRQAIRSERWKELAFEGHRHFDLMRWHSSEEFRDHLLKVNYPYAENFQVGKHELLPIPLTDLQANPKLKQNPGF